MQPPVLCALLAFAAAARAQDRWETAREEREEEPSGRPAKAANGNTGRKSEKGKAALGETGALALGAILGSGNGYGLSKKSCSASSAGSRMPPGPEESSCAMPNLEEWGPKSTPCSSGRGTRASPARRTGAEPRRSGVEEAGAERLPAGPSSFRSGPERTAAAATDPRAR